MARVEFRPIVDAPPGAFEALLDGGVIAVVQFLESEAELVVGVAPLFATLARPEAVELLRSVHVRGGEVGVARMRLASTDPCLRDTARRIGWEGGLREDLAVGIEAVTDVPGRFGAVDRDVEPGSVASGIESLVEGVIVRPRAGGAMRGALRRLRTGFPTIGFDVQRSGRSPMRLDVPARRDVLVEQVARAVDVVARVEERLGSAVPPLRLAFDHADFGLRHGTVSGEAVGGGDVHVNASWVYLDGMLEFRRRAEEHGAAARSARPVVRYNAIDGTTAHEVWHQIDFAFQARDYRASIEFRKGIGRALGVETLEHTLRGAERGAPIAWQRARDQLVTQVSAYAATSTQEATAEMFKLWWCQVGAPLPLIRTFGDLVETFVVAMVR